MESSNERPGTGLETIFLKDQKSMDLTGVEDILAFDDRNLYLKTASGCLNIDGENLHIELLSLEEGKLALTGRIFGLFYETGGGKKKSGLFGKKS